jgi:hypothetical protein
MSTTPTPTPNPNVLTVTKRVFNLDTLTKEKVTKTIPIPEPFTEQTIGSVDTKDLILAYNSYLLKKAKLEAKKEIVGADPTFINMYLRTFRMRRTFWVDKFGNRVDSEDKVDYAAQTAKIWAKIKSDPEEFEDLKFAASQAQKTSANEVEEEDDDVE